MSEPEKEVKKAPVKADVTIWQPGKSIQEMIDDEDAIAGGLMKALTVLSKKKTKFNIGSIYSELRKEGFEVEHRFIELLLKKKCGIKKELVGVNLYKALLPSQWVEEVKVEEKKEEEPKAVATPPTQ